MIYCWNIGCQAEQIEQIGLGEIGTGVLVDTVLQEVGQKKSF